MVREQHPQMVGCPPCRVAVTVEAFVGQGSVWPLATDVRRAWTLGERFQVMMLSGRSAWQRTLTSRAAVVGSAGLASNRAVRSSRSAQRRRCCGGRTRLRGRIGSSGSRGGCRHTARTADLHQERAARGAAGGSRRRAGAVGAGRHGEAGTADLAVRPARPGLAGVAAAATAADGAALAGATADGVARRESLGELAVMRSSGPQEKMSQIAAMTCSATRSGFWLTIR
ncbi:MAG: hypothetical protein JWM79_3992, partial [Nocardioides sp.]|nr:hypothetical protein [Nocardioides sp.]